MGFSMFFETSMFAAVTILISRFTVETVPLIQSALTSFRFLHDFLSLSMALTVIVGFEVGARRFGMRRYTVGSEFYVDRHRFDCRIVGRCFPFRSCFLYSNETGFLFSLPGF